MLQLNQKKIGASVVGLLFTLCFAEVALRIFHAVNPPPTMDNFDLGQLEDTDRIRILTVGESTTAAIGSGPPQHTWPALLEKMLNNQLKRIGAKERVAVFNIGRAASNTPFLVTEVENGLEKFNADVVISMMGINDKSIFFRERHPLAKWSHTYRFLYWASVAWTCPACFQIDLSTPHFAKVDRYTARQLKAVGKGTELFSQFQAEADTAQARIDEFLESLSKLQAEFGDDQNVLNIKVAGDLFMYAHEPSTRRRDETAKRRLLEVAESVLSKDYGPVLLLDEAGLETLCNIRLALGKNCLEEIKEAIKLGARIRAPLLTMATLNPKFKDPVIDKILSQAGFEFDPARRSFESTRISYIKMLNLVEKSNSLWFIMQYPTGLVNGLKGFFVRSYGKDFASYASSFYDTQEIEKVDPEFESAFKSVRFISNRNFVEIVNAENQSEYFSDYFGRDQGLDFGHAKLKGNEVIAKNAFEAIMADWSEITARAKLRRR
ncbi:MAG: SGNH/GDSL hydrolase family protein [Deltaproteobacteria bacterium]|nr:SGNH/GDSL hydrolase family protein [Deltaproteobacteria bacterium]